jgi:hypothetical protein
MQMKKGVLIGAVSVMLLSAVISLIVHFQNLQPYNASAIHTIPAQSSAILFIKSYTEIKTALAKNPRFVKDIQIFPTAENTIKFISKIDSLGIMKIEEFKDWNNRPFYISLSGENGTCLTTFFIELTNKTEEHAFKRLIKNKNEWFKLHSSQEHNGVLVYKVELKSLQLPFYTMILDGVVIFSTSMSPLMASIDQQTRVKTLEQDKNFARIRKTTGYTSLANLYLNVAKLPQLVEGSLNDMPSQTLLSLSQQASWCELDLDIQEEQLSLNGFMTLKEEDGFIHHLISGKSPALATLHQSFPFNTRYFLSYHFYHTEDLIDGVENYYLKNKQNTNKPLIATDTLKLALSLINKEIGIVHTQNENEAPNQLLVIKTTGASVASGIIEKLKNSKDPGSAPVTLYKPNARNTIPIYEGFTSSTLKNSLSTLFPDVPCRYYAFYNNHLIFSDKVEALTNFLYDNMLGKTIENQPSFKTYLQKYSSQQNLLLYIKPGYLEQLLESRLNDSMKKLLKNHVKTTTNFDAFGIQIASDNNLIYVNSYLSNQPARESEPQTTWQSRLDTAMIGKPIVVNNHLTGEKEILVQDAAYALYLLNDAGMVLWKKPLEGKILGDAIQIDFFKNKKLQYLFNTRERLYIVDRNGNDVEQYPIRLPSPATNPVSLFDYEKNMDYRFFLACEDGSIAVLNKEGKRLPDWSFSKTENSVESPILHVRIEDKDYIALVDASRVYLLDRKGNERVNVQANFLPSLRTPLQKLTTTQLVFATNNGKIAITDVPSGTIRFIQTPFVNDDFFVQTIVNQPDKFLVIGKNSISLLDKNGEAVWMKIFDDELKLSADIYQFGDGQWKVGCITRSGQIYLINMDGSIHQGFPLRGTSRFSITRFNSGSKIMNLLVGGDNSFLYHYQIQ